MLGQRLRQLRISRGMTQVQLADRLGVSASAIGMYEQGRRQPDNATLAKIRDEFSVSTDYLLGLPVQVTSPEFEFSDVMDDFTQLLEGQEGLMFNGSPLTKQDRAKIVDAIRAAAVVAVAEKKGG